MLTGLRNRIRKYLEPRAVILMYHQVSERPSDPWDLAVTPAFFGEQLDAIKEKFTVISMDDLAQSVRQRKLQHGTVAITFDDGFLDNFLEARPALQRRNLPATFYCTTHATETGETFWWEELESLILRSPELPDLLDLTIGRRSFSFRLTKHRVLTDELRNQIRLWRADTPPSNERTQLFFELWKRVQPLSYNYQKITLHDIRRWAGKKNDRPREVMHADELVTLSADDLFSIGAHTVHHAMLGEQDTAVQSYEVQSSKRTLEAWLRKQVNAFSYPYGNYNEVTPLLVKDAGFDHGVSTEAKSVTPDADIFRLPRIQVRNVSGHQLLKDINKILAL